MSFIFDYLGGVERRSQWEKEYKKTKAVKDCLRQRDRTRNPRTTCPGCTLWPGFALHLHRPCFAHLLGMLSLPAPLPWDAVWLSYCYWSRSCGPQLRPLLAWGLLPWWGKVLFPFRFTQTKTKPKLRLKPQKLYSMARKWRSRNLVHKSNSHPNGERDVVVLRREDDRRRADNEGEAYALVSWEELRFLLEVGNHFFSVLFGLELPIRAKGWCII